MASNVRLLLQRPSRKAIGGGFWTCSIVSTPFLLLELRSPSVFMAALGVIWLLGETYERQRDGLPRSVSALCLLSAVAVALAVLAALQPSRSLLIASYAWLGVFLALFLLLRFVRRYAHVWAVANPVEVVLGTMIFVLGLATMTSAEVLPAVPQ